MCPAVGQDQLIEAGCVELLAHPSPSAIAIKRSLYSTLSSWVVAVAVAVAMAVTAGILPGANLIASPLEVAVAVVSGACAHPALSGEEVRALHDSMRKCGLTLEEGTQDQRVVVPTSRGNPSCDLLSSIRALLGDMNQMDGCVDTSLPFG